MYYNQNLELQYRILGFHWWMLWNPKMTTSHFSKSLDSMYFLFLKALSAIFSGSKQNTLGMRPFHIHLSKVLWVPFWWGEVVELNSFQVLQKISPGPTWHTLRNLGGMCSKYVITCAVFHSTTSLDSSNTRKGRLGLWTGRVFLSQHFGPKCFLAWPVCHLETIYR